MNSIDSNNTKSVATQITVQNNPPEQKWYQKIANGVQNLGQNISTATQELKKNVTQKIADVAVGYVDETTPKIIQQFNDLLAKAVVQDNSLTAAQFQGLQIIVESLSSKLSLALKDLMQTDSAELITKTVEVNLLIILERYIKKIDSFVNKDTGQDLSSEELFIKILDSIAKDVRKAFDDELKKIEENYKTKIETNKQSNLSNTFKEANNEKFKLEFEKEKEELNKKLGHYILKALFPEGNQSIKIPSDHSGPAFKILHLTLERLLTDAFDTLSKHSVEMKKNYNKNLGIIQNFDKDNGSKVVDLVKGLTSQFNIFFKNLLSSEENKVETLIAERDPLANLLPELSKFISERLGQKEDEDGVNAAASLIGDYSKQILIHMFAHTCKDPATSKDHIVKQIIEKLLNKTLDFSIESTQPLKLAFAKYEKEMIRIKSEAVRISNNENESYTQKCEAIKKERDAHFHKLVDSLLKDLGLDLAGLKEILPNEFKGYLGTLLNSTMGKEASPAQKISELLKSSVTEFVVQFYRDVILTQDSEPSYKDKVLRYEETVQYMDTIIGSILPIINVSLTDPNSQLGESILSSINNMLLKKVQVEANFFTDPIRQLAQSTVFQKLEPFMQNILRQSLMGLLANLAIKSQPGKEKVDLLADSLPYMLKICIENVDDKKVIPFLTQWKKDFQLAKELLENTDEERKVKNKRLNDLSKQRSLLFKKAAETLLNEGGWDQSVNIPAPEMLKNSIKKMLSDTVLAELLGSIYADFLMVEDTQDTSKSVKLIDHLMNQVVPSIKDSVKELSPIISSAINQKLTLSQMHPEVEALLGYDLGQVLSSKDSIILPLWERLRKFLTEITTFSINQLSTEYKGEVNDPLMRAILQIKERIQNYQVKPNLQNDIVEYKVKVQEIKVLDENIAKLKKEAVQRVPQVNNEDRKLLPTLQKLLKRDGIDSIEIAKRKQMFLDEYRTSDELETFHFEAIAIRSELKNIETQLLAILNLQGDEATIQAEQIQLENAKRAKSSELEIIEKNIRIASGQDIIQNYDNAYYAALLNEIEKLTAERTDKFIKLHKDHAQSDDNIEGSFNDTHQLFENVLNLYKLAYMSETVEPLHEALFALQVDIKTKNEGINNLLNHVDLTPELQQKIKAEIDFNNTIMAILDNLRGSDSKSIFSGLNDIADKLAQKRQYLFKKQEQSKLVSQIEAFDTKLLAIKTIAAAEYNPQQTQTLLLEIKNYSNAVEKEEMDLNWEIKFIQNWMEIRKEIEARDIKPADYDALDTPRLQYAYAELAKRLYRLNKYKLKDPILQLKNVVEFNQETATTAWKSLIKCHEIKTNQIKQQLESTVPLQAEYEDLMAAFKPLSKQLIKDLNFSDPKNLPFPSFIQNFTGISLVDMALPSVFLELYSCAWVGQPEVKDLEDRALNGSLIGMPLFASRNITHVAVSQIKETLNQPQKIVDKLAAALKEEGFDQIDEKWLTSIFEIISTDDAFWSFIKDFVGSRLDYVIANLSKGQLGENFLPGTLKTLLSSFKTHVKDKRKEIDPILENYKKIQDEDQKLKLKKELSAQLFNGFIEEILAKGGLNNPESFGLAFAGPAILAAIKSSLAELCFNYCLDVNQNKEKKSKLPEEFGRIIQEGDPSLKPSEAASVQSVYESLFGFIGDQINNTIITTLKGGLAPQSPLKHIPVDLRKPFSNRWDNSKNGEWVANTEGNSVFIIQKDGLKIPSECEKIKLDVKGKEVTPFIIYKAVCNHTTKKLTNKILESISQKAAEYNIPLTDEFNSWLKDSLQKILEDEEVMKLLSDIPELIKEILLKKMVQLTQESVLIEGKEVFLKVNEIPGYVIKTVLDVFNKNGSDIKQIITQVLKDLHYDYSLDNAFIQENISDTLKNHVDLKKSAKKLVQELLYIIKFNPKNDLPPFPMLNEMWESTGPTAIEEMLIQSYVKICKIEFSRAQQKEEMNEILNDGELNDSTVQDLHKGIDTAGKKVLDVINKMTGIVPTEKENTSSFAHKIAATAMITIQEKLKLNERVGSKVFQEWLVQCIKTTLDDSHTKGLLNLIPEIIEEIINKKIVQLADLGPDGKKLSSKKPDNMMANVTLVLLDHMAEARQELHTVRTQALQVNPQISDEDLIEKLRYTSEKMVTSLFEKIKLNPGEDIPILFAEEIWDNFGKTALADFISDMYLKTAKFYDKDNQTALEYVLNPAAAREAKVREKIEATKRHGSFVSHDILALDALSKSQQIQKSPVIQSEEGKQIHNLLGALGDMIRTQVKKKLRIIPTEDKEVQNSFANDVLEQIFSAMGIQSKDISPRLVQWGQQSIEKIVKSDQVKDLIDEIPEKVTAIILNKLVQLGERTDMPIQPENDGSNLKYLPANLVAIFMKVIHANRQKLKPIAEANVKLKTELLREYEQDRLEVKKNWKLAKASLKAKYAHDPKLLKKELIKAMKVRNAGLVEREKKLQDNLNICDKKFLKNLMPICINFVDDLFKKEGFDINLGADIPVPYAQEIWDSCKSSVAEMLAKAYMEMDRPQIEKELHKDHLNKRYANSPITEAVKKYTSFALSKMKNVMEVDTPSLDAGIESLAEMLCGAGKEGQDVATYIKKNKAAIEDWMKDSNLKKIAKSKDKAINESLFSVVGENLEAVMLQIFDNFTGNIEKIEHDDKNFTYNFSMNMVKIFAEHLQAVNEVTKEAGKKYMYQVDPALMEKKMDDKGALHPDMPDYKIMIGIHTLKTQIESKEQILAKLLKKSTENAKKIAELNEALKADKESLQILHDQASSKMVKGTYSKLIKYILGMCNFDKAEDLPGPSLEVKKQLWEMLNGELGAEMVRNVCENFLSSEKINSYMLGLLQTINKKMEETCAQKPITVKTDKTKPVSNMSKKEIKKNQEQCLALLKSLAGAFPHTFEAKLLNLAARFKMTPEALEKVVRESLMEMPISAIIGQALVDGAETLGEVKLPQSQKDIDDAKTKMEVDAKESPEKIREESVHMVKNVLKIIWHSIKTMWNDWQAKMDVWIKDHLGPVGAWIKKELDFIFHTLFFTCIGTVVKWILKMPFKLIWKLTLERANRRDAEINRRVWADSPINANLVLFEAEALMNTLKKKSRRRKNKVENSKVQTAPQNLATVV